MFYRTCFWLLEAITVWTFYWTFSEWYVFYFYSKELFIFSTINFLNYFPVFCDSLAGVQIMTSINDIVTSDYKWWSIWLKHTFRWICDSVICISNNKSRKHTILKMSSKRFTLWWLPKVKSKSCKIYINVNNKIKEPIHKLSFHKKNSITIWIDIESFNIYVLFYVYL
jgi:hypothetical protein